jgi:hypothetical protein
MGPEINRPSSPLQNDGRSRRSCLAVLMLTTKPSPSLPPPLEMLWLTIPMTSPFMLNMGPQFADLIEQDRASIRERGEAFVPRHRSNEGPSFVAEQPVRGQGAG